MSEKNISLLLEKLTVGYDRPLIRDIALGLCPGTITTLIGPNGSGKSTILKTLADALKPIGGSIYLDGKNVRDMSGDETAKSMSIVMTENLRPEYMTCREMVETGRYPYTGRLGILAEEDRKKVNDAIKLMDIEDIAECDYRQISDGQRQRVMLARAICQDTKVLLLDEPTSYLDIRYKLDIVSRICDAVKDKGLTVVMSLHELEIAMKISDRVVAISPEGTYRVGTVKEIFKEDYIRSLYGIEDGDVDIIGARPWLMSDDDTDDLKKIVNADNIDNMVPTKGNDAMDANKGQAKVIMVQGTMSGVGKSLIVAGLCRIFSQDGYRVAPFKSQNMALNSYVTEDGCEIGRAQAMQAEAAGTKPSVYMNPILLKPNTDTGSQVIVMGKPMGDMSAREYFKKKKELIPYIIESFKELEKDYDIIVIEGAGSPAEINLKSNDIVNMGMAALVDAPVLLVGDIDRGGVFAQLLGTLDLLEKDERDRVKGLIINKFRGDASLLDSGIDILKEKSGIDHIGLVPYMNVRLEDEDSLSERLDSLGSKKEDKQHTTEEGSYIDIAVIRLKRMSNYTDMDPFEQFDRVRLRYISDPGDMGDPDMIIIPGSKNTVEDMDELVRSGMTDAICKEAKKGCVIFGICGGMQMLGQEIYEGPDSGRHEGLGLLPIYTVLGYDKELKQVSHKLGNVKGVFDGLSGCDVKGYEIHEGRTYFTEGDRMVSGLISGDEDMSVYGTYIHGIFDEVDIVSGIVKELADNKGIDIDTDRVYGYAQFKETQYRKLADILRESLDMDMIYKSLGRVKYEQ